MDFNGMNRKVLQSLCKTYGIPANTKNSEMATRLASFFKADGIKENPKLMERKDLQTLCKKHGIPANLKNNEMATRLASLFQETLSFTDLNEHCFVAELAKVEDECCEEDDESSLEKEIQIASLAVNFSEKEMEISNPESVLFAETTPPPSSVQLVVSSSESVLFVETTPPPPPVQLAVRNSESDLRVPTGHTIVKDIVPAVIAEEDIITSKEVPRSVHSFGAKLAEAEAVLEISAECWNQSLSSKDDERGPLDSEMQSANPHGNFSDCNTVKIFVKEQADICEVGCISAGYCVNQEMLDEVKDDSLTKSELIVSTERDCKLNVLELRGSLSKDFTSLSPKEENVSERNLMLMEQLSANGKIRAADTVTHHNDEAAESHAVVFTAPEEVLLLGDSELNEVGKEEEQTDFPEESDVLSTSENEGESIVVELHDEPNIAASPLPHTAGNQELKEVESSDESAFLTRLERESGQDSLGNGKSGSTHYQSHHASSPKAIMKNDSVVLERHVAAPYFRENTIADSSGSLAHKVSYIHEFNAEEETAVEELAITDEPIEAKVTKNSQRDYNGNILLDSSGGSSVSGNICVLGGTEDEHLGCNSEEAFGKTCEKSGCKVLKDEATGRTATPFEQAMSQTPNESTVQDNIMKEGLEAAQGTSKQSRLHSPHVNSVTLSDFDTEEGAEITIEAERNVTLSFYVLPLPAEGDSETIGEISSQLDVGGTCSMVLAAGEEKVRSEATLSPEEALNESAENKECANIGDSCTLSEKKQVIREPNLIYRTQVKPKRHDMKENAPHSKTVENLNVTAPRTSKRKPLQDLRNIREEPNTVFKPTQIWKPKTSQPKHKTCNKEVSLLSTAQHIQTRNRFAVLSDYDDF